MKAVSVSNDSRCPVLFHNCPAVCSLFYFFCVNRYEPELQFQRRIVAEICICMHAQYNTYPHTQACTDTNTHTIS